MNTTFVEISIDDVAVKDTSRKDNGDLTTLENSIRKLGLLCPLIVDRENVLISGSRRLQACRNAGLTEIPVLKLDVEFGSMTALDIHGDENLCRLPLSAEELEDLIKRKKSTLASGTAPTGGGTVLGGIKRMLKRM